MNKKTGLILAFQTVIAIGANDFMPGFKKGCFANGLDGPQRTAPVSNSNNPASTSSWSQMFYTDIGPITRTFEGSTQIGNMIVVNLLSVKGSSINDFEFKADLILNPQLTREDYVQNILQSGLTIINVGQLLASEQH
jgi:hypothetical protein